MIVKCISLFTIFPTLSFMSFSFAVTNGSKPLGVGDSIPIFSFKDQNAKTFNIADYIGKKVLVVYFYPRDESMVCTKEACAFRDSSDDFIQSGALIIGINDGSVASHKAFETHYKLPFILLSDPGNKVYNQFGIKNKLFMTGRKTFVIDLKGKIVYTHEAMLAGQEHAEDALKYIKQSMHKK